MASALFMCGPPGGTGHLLHLLPSCALPPIYTNINTNINTRTNTNNLHQHQHQHKYTHQYRQHNINTRKQNNWHHQHDTNTNIYQHCHQLTPPQISPPSNRNHYNLKLKQSGYEVKFRCFFLFHSWRLLLRFFPNIVKQAGRLFLRWAIFVVLGRPLWEGGFPQGLTMLGACLPSNCPPDPVTPCYRRAYLCCTYTSLPLFLKKKFLNHQTILYSTAPGPAHTSIVGRAGSPNLEFTDLKGELKASYKSGSNSIV